MLILTRRAGETLVIGDDIRITVLGVNESQVRLAVKAPRAKVSEEFPAMVLVSVHSVPARLGVYVTVTLVEVLSTFWICTPVM